MTMNENHDTKVWCMKDKNGDWHVHEHLRALSVARNIEGMNIQDCMHVIAENIVDSAFYTCGAVIDWPPIDFTVISDTEFTYVNPDGGKVMHWKYTSPTNSYDIEYIMRVAARIHRHNSNPNTKHYILVKP